MGFSPRMRRHVCTDKCEIWQGQQARSPCKIQHLSVQKFRIIARETVKIRNFCYKIAPGGRIVCSIFTNSLQHFCASTAFVFNLVTLGDRQPLYKLLTSISAFSPQIFNIPRLLATKLLIGSEKSLYINTVPSLVGIVHRRPAQNKKKVMFCFVFLLRS